MDGMHGGTVVSSVDFVAPALRVLVLVSTAAVAGAGLLRPAVRAITPRTAEVIWLAGVLAAAASIASIVVVEADPVFALVHGVLVLAVPALLWRPSPALYLGFGLTVLLVAETAAGHSSFELILDVLFTIAAVVWLGLSVLSTVPAENRRVARPGPVALSVAVALGAAGITKLFVSGLGLDRRLYDSAYGLVLLFIATASVFVVALTAVLLRREPDAHWRVYRYGAVSVTAAFLSWGALPAIPLPPELPVPGVPRLAQVRAGPVLVTPHRPGRNIVHFPESAGRNLSAGVSGGPLLRAVARPGSEGTWAEVDLPEGRSDLAVSNGASQDRIDVDTGTAPGFPSATGPDGPECASAVLGGLVTGARNVLARCPADSLAPTDAEAVTRLVGFIADNDVAGITLAGDASPRSRAAADVVRAAAAAKNLRVSESPQEGDALVVVSGWSAAARQLDTVTHAPAPVYAHGVYLAPWLLHAPLVNAVASSSMPLRFDPRDQRSLQYGMALASGFGEAPSYAGFAGWLAAHGQDLAGPVSIYASAQVDVMKMPGMPEHHGDLAGQWLRGGTVVAISGPVSP